jgi:hypothetical protein
MKHLSLIALAPLFAAACAAPTEANDDAESAESAHTAAAAPLMRSAHMLVALEGGGAVEVDARTGAIEHSYATGSNAFGAAYDPIMLNRGYVTDKTAGTLSMIDVDSDRVVRTIPVGNGAQQPALDTISRSALYVPLSDEGKVVEVPTYGSQESEPQYFKVERTLDLGATSKPHIASMSPPDAGYDRTLWVTVQGPDPRVTAIKIAWDERDADHFTVKKDLRNGKTPRVVRAVSGGAYVTFMDSTSLWFASDAGSLKEVYSDVSGPASEPAKQIEGVSAAKNRVAITHEGRKALVVLTNDAKSCEIGLGAKPYWVSLDPGAKVAYVSLPDIGEVQAFDVAGCKQTPLFTADVGGKPKRLDLTRSWNDLTLYDWEEVLSCDGGKAIVRVNPNERRELAIEIRHEGAVGWLGGAPLPRGISFAPDKKSMRAIGGNRTGVFDHATFTSLTSTDEAGTQLHAFRDAGGLKVQANTFSIGSGPNGWEPVNIREARNWWFPNCQVK